MTGATPEVRSDKILTLLTKIQKIKIQHKVGAQIWCANTKIRNTLDTVGNMQIQNTQHTIGAKIKCANTKEN